MPVSSVAAIDYRGWFWAWNGISATRSLCQRPSGNCASIAAV
jgi:hypothetical protein